MTRIKSWVVYAYEGSNGAREWRKSRSFDYVVRAINKVHAIRMFHEKTHKRYKRPEVKISIRVI